MQGAVDVEPTIIAHGQRCDSSHLADDWFTVKAAL
jgi:hypothetical protein